MLYFSGSYLAVAIKTGIITGILSLTVSGFTDKRNYYPTNLIEGSNWFGVLYVFQEGIAVGRTFAGLRNYQVDGNKEMMAIGFMNMAGSCSSCYVTTGEYPPHHNFS